MTLTRVYSINLWDCWNHQIHISLQESCKNFYRTINNLTNQMTKISSNFSPSTKCVQRTYSTINQKSILFYTISKHLLMNTSFFYSYELNWFYSSYFHIGYIQTCNLNTGYRFRIECKMKSICLLELQRIDCLYQENEWIHKQHNVLIYILNNCIRLF